MSTSADAREGQEPNAGQDPSVEKDPRISTAQNWYKAKDEADHYNRNLMQYGGAVAAVLTILAGSGGIFAVATAVKVEDNPYFDWAATILGGSVSSGPSLWLSYRLCWSIASFAEERPKKRSTRIEGA